MNSAAHKNYRDKVYIASKAKMAATLAFDALAGLGTKEDTAYFIVHQNKTISIIDMLDQMSQEKTPPLGLTIHGTGGYANKVKKLQKGETEVEKYNRSRDAVKIFLELKATLSV